MQKPKKATRKAVTKTESIAHHEAGHAVAMCVLGIDLKHVALAENGFGGGCEPVEDIRYDAPAKYAHSYLIAVICGREGQRLFSEEWIPPENDFGPGMDDDEMIFMFALMISGGNIDGPERSRKLRVAWHHALDAIRDMGRIRAQILMQKHKRHVKAVAKELLKRRKLTGSEVMAIIEK